EGRADDVVTATVLCAKGPVLVAPAMHPRMWSHPATQRNVATLAASGVELVGPVAGEGASGDGGGGRVGEPARIAPALQAARSRGPAAGAVPSRDLSGRHVVVTAGPTFEALDPVRFLGNRSSGKMGFAIAGVAATRGARVTLVSGPVALATPPNVLRLDVE